MADRSIRELIDRKIAALNARDWDAFREGLHPDFVEEYPQSGERIRGRDNFIETIKNYPGGLGDAPGAPTMIIDPPEHWVMTPGFTVVRVTAGTAVHTVVVRIRYRDGSVWFMINLVQLKDGLIWRQTTYFAPAFDPPEWRRQWVELAET